MNYKKSQPYFNKLECLSLKLKVIHPRITFCKEGWNPPEWSPRCNSTLRVGS